MSREPEDYEIAPFDPGESMVFKAHPMKQEIDELKATRERARAELGPCEHPAQAQELVYVDSTNGVRMYAFECQECGCLPKMWVKQAKLTAEQKRSARPRREYRDRPDTRRGKAARLVSFLTGMINEAFDRLYQAYVGEMSPEWRTRRRAVFFRDGFLCRYCETSAAQEVHHLTYRNLGDEPLDELIAICRDCHRGRHHAGEDT